MAQHEDYGMKVAAILRRQADRHFRHGAAAKLTQALIDGHPKGALLIQPDEHWRIARLWSYRITKETGRERKLNNAVVNLSSDHYRTSTDRLVPTDPDSIHPDLIYTRMILTPPQFGSAS